MHASPPAAAERRVADRRQVIDPRPADTERRQTERRSPGAGLKMECPECGCSDSLVTNSRPTTTKSAIRRRRQCAECGHRFTTYERIEAA